MPSIHGGVVVLVVTACLLGAVPEAGAQLPTCPQDSVRSGPVCIDKWEASVWYIPPTPANAYLVTWIRTGNVPGLKGGAGLASPSAASKGVVQLGLTAGDLAARGCPDSGNGCKHVYAASVPGVFPSAFVTWFQAAAAARNSLKRLPSNQEWQVAALGTPDGALCNIGTALAVTGSSAGCVSDVGVFDMVGNLYEWVAEWVPRSTTCTASLFGTGDQNCLAGADTGIGPGALLRGGGIFDEGAQAGVFAMEAGATPAHSDGGVGFRGVR
jgi:hypothetical protein